MSFSSKTFLTIFVVKSKLSTAKKSKTTTFSRVFHPKKIDNFLGKSKLNFWTKNEVWITNDYLKIFCFFSRLIWNQTDVCTWKSNCNGQLKRNNRSLSVNSRNAKVVSRKNTVEVQWNVVSIKSIRTNSWRRFCDNPPSAHTAATSFGALASRGISAKYAYV